jgi:hypothetical protein
MLENTEKAIPTVDASECALLERETASLSHDFSRLFFFTSHHLLKSLCLKQPKWVIENCEKTHKEYIL